MDPQRQKGLIPPNVIANVGQVVVSDATYLRFSLNEHSLVIQAPPSCIPLLPWRAPHDMATQYDQDMTAHLNGLFREIQNLLHKIDFSAQNWAHLFRDSNGHYNLIPKSRQLYRISCPLWAPLVEENEIVATSFTFPWLRTAFWNDQDVDVKVCWTDWDLKWMEHETVGRGAIKDLDLSFPVLAHITRGGEVVGLMTEAAEGRMIEYRDKLKVHAAFAKLQQHNIILAGCINGSTIMIHKGKVRLLQPQCLRVYSEKDKDEVEKQARYWHWESLDSLFHELSYQPNELPCVRLLMASSSCLTITPAPGVPGRPIPLKLFVPMDRSVPLLVSWFNERKTILARERKRRAKEGTAFPLLDYLFSAIGRLITLEDRRILMPISARSLDTGTKAIAQHPYRPPAKAAVAPVSDSDPIPVSEILLAQMEPCLHYSPLFNALCSEPSEFGRQITSCPCSRCTSKFI
ncbi:hypothetical protein C8J56DRAFT_33573 [Mycena floridula]|nr:hypothetical protein C8J56DRAFT_33573 [Mycena floridula]